MQLRLVKSHKHLNAAPKTLKRLQSSHCFKVKTLARQVVRSRKAMARLERPGATEHRASRCLYRPKMMQNDWYLHFTTIYSNRSFLRDFKVCSAFCAKISCAPHRLGRNALCRR